MRAAKVKKTPVSEKLANLGMKGVAGGGDPAVMREARQKTIGMISGDKVEPRLDKVPRRAAGGSVMAPAASSNPMAVTAKKSGGSC